MNLIYSNERWYGYSCLLFFRCQIGSERKANKNILSSSHSSTDPNRSKAANQGAIAALLDALELNKRIAEVEEYVCGALWNIAVPAVNQVTMSSMGGIQAILNTLRLHKKNEAVVHQALGCLWNLAVNGTKRDVVKWIWNSKANVMQKTWSSASHLLLNFKSTLHVDHNVRTLPVDHNSFHYFRWSYCR